MADKLGVQGTVQRIVAEVLQSHLPGLRDEIARRAMEEIQFEPAGDSNGSSTLLLKSIAAVESGSGQREILRTLLDESTMFCARAALFLVKSGKLQGWEGRGFADNDSLKDFPFSSAAPAMEATLSEKKSASGVIGEVDANFAETFGASEGATCLLLPLVLKDKVAAILYADAGKELEGKLDQSSLEILMNCTSRWLEILSLKKSSAAPAPEASAPPEPQMASASAAAPVTEPPVQEAAAQEAVEVPVPEAAVAVAAGAEATPIPVVPVAPPPAAPVEPVISPQDAEVHRKAERFARLLIDEIKLYNHAKVEEGRKNRDLFSRLKPDIEKSRSTYEKRYGQTAAAAGDYFHRELIRSLAQDDPSLMGSSSRH